MSTISLINGLSDSYKANQISIFVRHGAIFTDDEVCTLLNGASDSYKRNILKACKGGLFSISQVYFVKMCNSMSDSYKTEFAIECLPLIIGKITSSTLILCLSSMSDSYKISFISVLLPNSQPINHRTLCSMLTGMSDSYKAGFISTCLSHIAESLNANMLSNILCECSDSYKANIISTIGTKLVLNSYDDISAIIHNTSDSYKSGLTSLLLMRIQPKKSDPVGKKITHNIIKNQKKKTTSADEMSDEMVHFMTDSVCSAVNIAVANLDYPKIQEEEKKEIQCVICLDAPPDWAIIPCGHKVCCEPCVKSITSCPICRGNKEQIIKVFG